MIISLEWSPWVLNIENKNCYHEPDYNSYPASHGKESKGLVFWIFLIQILCKNYADYKVRIDRNEAYDH